MTKKSSSTDNFHIGLSSNSRTTGVDILNRLLADEFVLYARARAFHWNVQGRSFKSDHALFEDEYEALDETIDTVAERARTLGGMVQARLSDFLKSTTLKEADSTKLSSDAMIASLLEGHEALIRSLRKDIEVVSDVGDEGTADFLTSLMSNHEKRAWMLRSTVAA